MDLLVPIDGSDQSLKALRYAVDTFPDASITLLHVAVGSEGQPVTKGTLEEWRKNQRERADEFFEAARAEVGDDVEIDSALVYGPIAKKIIEYAEENDVDAIVMGTRGRDSAARILLGSEAETVVRRAPVPVTVVR